MLSGNEHEVLAALGQHRHGAFVYQRFILPRNVQDWYLADLEASLEEFKSLTVARTPYWGVISNGTHKLSEAADNLAKTKFEDPQTKRIKGTISVLDKDGSINLEGIILLCKKADESDGPWEIIEGQSALSPTPHITPRV